MAKKESPKRAAINEQEAPITVSAEALSVMLRRLSVFAKVDDSHPILNGALIEIGKGFLRGASADGFALLSAQMDIPHAGASQSIVLPLRDVNDIAAALRRLPRGEPAGIRIVDDVATINADRMTFTSRAVQGSYPKVGDLITKAVAALPKEAKAEARVALAPGLMNKIVTAARISVGGDGPIVIRHYLPGSPTSPSMYAFHDSAMTCVALVMPMYVSWDEAPAEVMAQRVGLELPGPKKRTVKRAEEA